MIFMGSFTGGRGGSSTEDTGDDEPERDPEQPGLGEYVESEDDGSEDDSGGASVPSSPIPGSGGSGGGGAAEPVTEEPPENDGEESDGEDSGEDEELTAPDVEKPDVDESEDDDEDDDEDEEDETVTVTITVDPMNALSWGIQPVVTRVTENYGDQVEFEYNLAPVRTFDDPKAMRQQWGESIDLHDMPVDPSFWDEPPESTDLVNRALVAAMRQDAGGPYLRILWREGIASGQTIDDEDALTETASRLGLDVDTFQDDMVDADLETDTERDELPVTKVPIRGYTQTWTGNVHYTDFKEQFIFEGLDEGDPRDPDLFVEDHGPVETAEVMEVYQWDRERVNDELREMDEIYSMDIGKGTFWVSE